MALTGRLTHFAHHGMGQCNFGFSGHVAVTSFCTSVASGSPPERHSWDSHVCEALVLQNKAVAQKCLSNQRKRVAPKRALRFSVASFGLSVSFKPKITTLYVSHLSCTRSRQFFTPHGHVYWEVHLWWPQWQQQEGQQRWRHRDSRKNIHHLVARPKNQETLVWLELAPNSTTRILGDARRDKPDDSCCARPWPRCRYLAWFASARCVNHSFPVYQIESIGHGGAITHFPWQNIHNHFYQRSVCSISTSAGNSSKKSRWSGRTKKEIDSFHRLSSLYSVNGTEVDSLQERCCLQCAQNRTRSFFEHLIWMLNMPLAVIKF